MKRLTLLVAVVTCCLLAAGCGSAAGPAVSRGQVGNAYTERLDEGRVVRAEPVVIEGGGGGLGSLVGGEMAGGGSSSTQAVVRVAGSTPAAGRQQGVQITVKLDSGGTVSVVQRADPDVEFRVGDMVRVYCRSDGTACVLQ